LASVATGTVVDPVETPYDGRVSMTETLALRFPGPVDNEPTFGRFGLWAGILVQTDWQRSSKRSELQSWNRFNASLSVEPSLFASSLGSRESGRDEACASNAFVQADPAPSHDDLPDRAAACRAWVGYFQAAARREPDSKLIGLMWAAHTASLVSTLREHPRVFDESATPAEQNFLSSWFEIVLLLAAIDFDAGASTSVPARNAIMPNCSPLNTPGCQLTRSDLGGAFDFASTLAAHPVSTDKIFSLYRQLKASPSLLIASVVGDFAITKSLQAYLTAAGFVPAVPLPFSPVDPFAKPPTSN